MLTAPLDYMVGKVLSLNSVKNTSCANIFSQHLLFEMAAIKSVCWGVPQNEVSLLCKILGVEIHVHFYGVTIHSFQQFLRG
jgi:hypothetical protein